MAALHSHAEFLQRWGKVLPPLYSPYSALPDRSRGYSGAPKVLPLKGTYTQRRQETLPLCNAHVF
jgi:hypothetical protein